MSTPPTIRRISYAQFLSAPNAQELISAYAAECLIPDAQPQHQTYTALEQSGAFQGFGAYAGDDLVGFVTVVSSVMPHNGKRAATVESVYVSPSHRGSSAGNALLSAAEQYAAESGCVVILYTARVDSPFETVLSRRSGCKESHTVFSRWL
jgi:GNAT superfamily N-acetyltransferase